MPKALLASSHGITVASGSEMALGGLLANAAEAQSQVAATEGCSFTGLRGLIVSGNDAVATFRLRVNGANGNNIFAQSLTGSFEDTTPHTDTLAAGDLFNWGYTDTGANSVLGPLAINVTMASGHGNFHIATATGAIIFDVGSATRYIPIQGLMAVDGTATIANAQFKVREYTTLEAFQVRVTANARVNDSVFSVNVNGTDVGTPITFATTVTGLQTVTGMGIALSPGDLVCISITLAAGVEDLTVSFVGATFKSTSLGSASGYAHQTGVSRTASATPNYYSFGQNTTTTLANAQVKVGFAARCKNLRCYLSANTYTADAQLNLLVNGSTVLTTTITAGGGAAWYENTVDTADIDADDVVNFEIVGGTANSITINQIWITFGQIPITGTMAAVEGGGEAGDDDIFAATGTSDQPAAAVTPQPSQGGGSASDYAARVRAKWDEIEAMQAERREREARETEIAARLKDRQLQLAEMERKKRRDSAKSAAAKRRVKLAAEIDALQAEQAVMAQQVAALVAMIMQMQTEIAEAEKARLMTAARRRRMVLLLATVA